MAPDDNGLEPPESPGGSHEPDNGEPPEPEAIVSVAPATVDEGGQAAFVVTLSEALGTGVMVHWRTEDWRTEEWTATAGEDYEAVQSGTVGFEPGATRQTISVETFDDEVHEEDETFEVVLTGVSPPGAASLGQARATGTIADDDPPPDDHGDTRATATSITEGDPMSGRLEMATDIDFFQVTVTSSGTLYAATDPGRVGDPGYAEGTEVRIESSGYTSPNSDHVDVADVDLGPATSTEVYVRVSGGYATRYDLAVWLLDPTESDTSFDIELRYLGTEPTTAQKNIIRTAADTWEDIITGDLTLGIIIDSGLECADGDPSTFGDTVDDLRIDVRLQKIDGARGTLATAGPCVRRTGGLPLIGDVTIDTDDLTWIGTEGLRRTVVHEIAHVLGYGTSDQWLDLLRNSAVEYKQNNPDAGELPDTHFVGTAAVSAFAELLAGAAYSGARVPVENDTERYGEGGLDGHWREAVFGDELLTATISAAPQVRQPLSKVTIASLADLGYRVDYTQAESYSLPSSSRLRAQSAQDELYLGDHIRRGPVIMVDIPE